MKAKNEHSPAGFSKILKARLSRFPGPLCIKTGYVRSARTNFSSKFKMVRIN